MSIDFVASTHAAISLQKSTVSASLKRCRWMVCCAAFSVALMAPTAATRNTERSLLNASVRVESVVNDRFIWWQSPTQFLGYDAKARVFRTHDLRLHTISEETGLSETFAKTGGIAYQAYLSPDGRQLLWVGRIAANTYTFMSPIHGGRYTLFPRSSDSQFAWASTSGSWLEWFQGPHSDTFDRAILHVVAPPGIEKYYDLQNMPLGPHRSREIFYDNNKRLLLAIEPDAIDPTSYLIHQGTITNETVEFTSVSPVRLPSKARLWDIKISPQGDKVAWLLARRSAYPSQHTAPSRDIRSAYRLPVESPGDQIVDLWISNIDGSHFRSLGSLRAPDPSYPTASQRELAASGPIPIMVPTSISWLPENDSLSYIHDHVLYTVKAPSVK